MKALRLFLVLVTIYFFLVFVWGVFTGWGDWIALPAGVSGFAAVTCWLLGYWEDYRNQHWRGGSDDAE